MPDLYIYLFFNTFVFKIVNNFFCYGADYILLIEKY